mmetsp:Transcript_35519/g.65126  ORF Transcript_35519/g.65126 Transcript_35519/m.65126 type:complete len:223 (+) Transcript_35519:493-1161(+)
MLTKAVLRECIPDQVLVPVPICLAVFHHFVYWVHGVDQTILVRSFVTARQGHLRPDVGKCHTRKHLIGDVCHVDRLIWLCVAHVVNWQNRLVIWILLCGRHLPRMVVDVIPLLGKSSCAGPRREGGEALRIHARRICSNDAAPIAVDHVANTVSHRVQLVNARVAEEAKRLADVVHVFKLISTGQVQSSVGAARKRVDSVLEEAVGVQQEGDITDAEAAGLL